MLALHKNSEPSVPKQKIAAVSIQGKGRGVIAKSYIAKGEVIEICPAILLTPEECAQLDGTLLEHYLFSWSNPGQYSPEYKNVKELWTIPTGCGMLYNHSAFPNADYHLDFSRKAIVYTALSNISATSEVCINYNIPLWFEER